MVLPIVACVLARHCTDSLRRNSLIVSPCRETCNDDHTPNTWTQSRQTSRLSCAPSLWTGWLKLLRCGSASYFLLCHMLGVWWVTTCQCKHYAFLPMIASLLQEYKLVSETLYLAVSYVDRYLSQRPVQRNKLQLVGVTCMLLASKYEEIYAPLVHPLLLCDEYEAYLLSSRKQNWHASTTMLFSAGLGSLILHHLVQHMLWCRWMSFASSLKILTHVRRS